MWGNSKKKSIETKIRRLEDDRQKGIRQLTEAVKVMNFDLANGGNVSARLRRLIDRCDARIA